MIDKDEELHFKSCIASIEDRLQWGTSQTWGNYDFERLSIAIQEKTGTLLSVTTLKRIWGKVRYEHTPTITTLNTLARFLDYADWRSFRKKRNEASYHFVENLNGPIVEKRKFNIPFPILLTSVIASIAMLFLFFTLNTKAGKSPNPADYSFMASKVISEGVPNSVVFTYNASKAHSDSVYIVQTWDIRRKTLVSKNDQKHSAIYYYPGYFLTRLIADGKVVGTHDLQISTDGWLCLIEREPVPIYLKKEDCVKEDRIEVEETILKKYNLTLNPNPPKVRFFNQGDLGDLGDLMNDQFVFQTTLKNESDRTSNSCQNVEVLIQCKNDIIIIPLATQTCIGDLRLYAAGFEMNSKRADLSGFGADLNQWITLRVESVNKHMRFLVNGKLAASFDFPNDPTGIVGVQYRFNGTGAVRDTWFENKSGRRQLVR